MRAWRTWSRLIIAEENAHSPTWLWQVEWRLPPDMRAPVVQKALRDYLPLGWQPSYQNPCAMPSHQGFGPSVSSSGVVRSCLEPLRFTSCVRLISSWDPILWHRVVAV